MIFDDAVISAVTGHMNGDHAEDNLLIARAFGFPEATVAAMTDLDAERGYWRVEDPGGVHELALSWLGGAVAERRQIRREAVMLYRAACERLGVPPRVEHGEAPEGHGGHPHGGHGSAAVPAGVGDEGFARRVREATWSDHSDSEGAGFMADIMRGRGTLADYTELVAQHWFMYEALEEAAALLVADERLSRLHPAALRRTPALERDLVHLLGERWRTLISPVPATAAYARRIRAAAAEGWTAGVVAHHYTRYLGDLSGGQVIARRVAKQFGFDGGGVEFYDFAELGDPGDFKTAYRQGLDELGAVLDEAERVRMLDEVRTAYRFNTEVFIDLGEGRTAA